MKLQVVHLQLVRISQHLRSKGAEFHALSDTKLYVILKVEIILLHVQPTTKLRLSMGPNRISYIKEAGVCRNCRLPALLRPAHTLK